MGLTLDMRARTGPGGVAVGRGTGVVATLLVALAAAAAVAVAVARIVDAVLRPDAIRVATATLALAWMAAAVSYRRAGKPELAAAAALIALVALGWTGWLARRHRVRDRGGRGRERARLLNMRDRLGGDRRLAGRRVGAGPRGDRARQRPGDPDRSR